VFHCPRSRPGDFRSLSPPLLCLFHRRCRWTTAKRLTGVLDVVLILSDSQYKGWQPGKDDLLDIESGLLCFVDKHGKLSSKEARGFEEEEEEEEEEDGTDSYVPTSSEPSPQSVPSMERSTSGSSSTHPSAGSPGSIDEAVPARTSLSPTTVNEATQPAPSKPEPVPKPGIATESLEAAVLMDVQPDITTRTFGAPGGPPPPDGRFFNNPVSLRTLMTGSGDGYRSPEPPSRLDTLFPLQSAHRECPRTDSYPTDSGFNLSEMATERLGPSFSAQQPVSAQSPGGFGFGMEYGRGSMPAVSSSSVLPVELVAYNDLMMDIGIAQCLGTGMQDLGSPPFVHPSMSTNDGEGVDGYQWQGISEQVMHELPQTTLPFGYPQPGQAHHGGSQSSAQQAGANFGGQWPTAGIVDYKWVSHHLLRPIRGSHERPNYSIWERALYESFMMGQQTNQRFQG
jgi:hypothetical protein